MIFKPNCDVNFWGGWFLKTFTPASSEFLRGKRRDIRYSYLYTNILSTLTVKKYPK